MQKTEIKEKNIFLNIIKAICAILVVFIHCPFPGKLGVIIYVIARIAVPIFFMISGYYCYNNTNEKIIKKAKKILKLIVYSYGIYIIVYMLINNFNGNGVYNYIKDIFNIKELIKFILFNEWKVCIPLWYLSAILFCYLTYNKLNKNINYLYILIPLLLIFHMVGKEVLYIYFDNKYSYVVRNFLLFGLPFFMLGNYVKHKQDKIIKSITNKKLLMVIIIGIILAIIERYFRFSKHFYMGTIISVLGIFILAIKNPKYINNRILEIIGEKDSTFIYLWHTLFIELINYVHINTNIWNILKPIIVVLLTIISSKIYRKLKETILITKLEKIKMDK